MFSFTLSRRTIVYHISFDLKISASSIITLLYTLGMWSAKMRFHMDTGLLTPTLGCCRSKWTSRFAHPHPYLLSHSLPTDNIKPFGRKGCACPHVCRETSGMGSCHTHAVYVEITGHKPTLCTRTALLTSGWTEALISDSLTGHKAFLCG